MPVPGAPDRPVFLAQLQPFATANPIASPVSIALELLGLRVPYPNPKIVMAGLVPDKPGRDDRGKRFNLN
jgi:hypothetical protein